MSAVRVKKGIDGRQAVLQFIHHRHGDQLALVVKAVIAGAIPGVVQKGLVLLPVRRIHIPVGMAQLDVAVVQVKASSSRISSLRRTSGPGCAARCVAARAGLEIRYWNTGGNAGIAVGAVGAVDVVAAAPEAQYRQIAVQLLSTGWRGSTNKVVASWSSR